MVNIIVSFIILFIKDNFYIDYNYTILFIILVLIYAELKYKNIVQDTIC